MVSPSLTFRTDVQFVQMPAKHAMGWVSSSAIQTTSFFVVSGFCSGVYWFFTLTDQLNRSRCLGARHYAKRTEER
jgi:hypothetical protein